MLTPASLRGFLSQETPRSPIAEISRAAFRNLQFKTTWPFHAFFLISLVVSGLLFPWRVFDELRLDFGSPLAARGRILSVGAPGTDASTNPVSRVRFVFHTESGQEVFATSYGAALPREGSEVKIQYLAQKPQAARVRSHSLSRFGYAGALALVGPLFLGCILSYVRRRRSTILFLLERGTYARGYVVNLKNVNRADTRTRHCVISLQIPDRDHARSVDYKSSDSSEIALAEFKKHENAQIDILYNPDKPSQLLLAEALLGERMYSQEVRIDVAPARHVRRPAIPVEAPSRPKNAKTRIFNDRAGAVTLWIPRRGGKPLTWNDIGFCVLGCIVTIAPLGFVWDSVIRGGLILVFAACFMLAACLALLTAVNVLWEQQEIVLGNTLITIRRKGLFSRSNEIPVSAVTAVSLASFAPEGFLRALRHFSTLISIGYHAGTARRELESYGAWVCPTIEWQPGKTVVFGEMLSLEERKWLIAFLAAHVENRRECSSGIA